MAPICPSEREKASGGPARLDAVPEATALPLLNPINHIVKYVRKYTHTFALLGSILLLVACQPQESARPETTITAAERSAYLAKSEALAGKLQKALGSQLMAAMKEGGPPAAVRVCQGVAQDITRVTSEEEADVSIRRTALRVRNPANQPAPDSVQVLEDWRATLEAGNELRPSLLINKDNVIVHRPIMTAAICLQCHGEPEQIQNETRTLVNQLYPEDQATGFAAGSLRGAFRIEFTR